MKQLHSKLWSMSDPQVVWNTYELDRLRDRTDYSSFFEHAELCINQRRPAPFHCSKDGAWLSYFPYHAMFEDVATEITDGFFGSGDCPPPAFWEQVKGDALLSFIPKEYRDLASIGVDVCVNDTLAWAEI